MAADELKAVGESEPANPYTVHESVGVWAVRIDGWQLATCPDERTARQIAAALWESQQRRQG